MPIRPLTGADAALYHRVRLRALLEHPDAFGADAREWQDAPLEAVVARLTRPNGFVLGAFEDGALVGNAGAFREDSPKVRHKATIVGVYVAPEARGRGLGRALVLAAMERAGSWDGITQLHLSVATPNEAARRLYASLGFRVIGREPRALRLPD